MKKFLLTVFFLFFLIGGGAVFLIIHSFNATAYQKQIETALSELTGRSFVVAGRTVVKWRPLPTVELSQLTLSNSADSPDKEMLQIERARVEIEWSSLFKTPLVVKSIALEKPTLLLERSAAGKVNFAFPFFNEPRQFTEGASLLAQGPSSDMRIDTLSVKSGTVRYINRATGMNYLIQDVSGSFAIQALPGPYCFTGTGDWQGSRWDISFQTGAIEASSPIDLTLKLGEPKSGLQTDFTGTLTLDSRETWLHGGGSFSVKKPNVLAAAFKLPQLHRSLDTASVGNFALELSDAQTSLKSLTIRFGDGEQAVALTGSLTHSVKEAGKPFAATIGFNTLDMAVWQEYLNLFSWSSLDRLKDLPRLTVQLSAQQVQFASPFGKADKTPRTPLLAQDLEAKIGIDKNALTLSDLKITLPGNLTATLRGSGKIESGVPTVRLETQLRGAALKPLLVGLWPHAELLEKTSLLQKTDFSGRVVIAPKKLSLQNINWQVDASRLTGQADIDWTGKPSIQAKLRLNQLDIGSYIALKPSPKPLTAALHDIRVFFEKLPLANQINGQAEIDFNELTIARLPITSGRLVASVADNVIKIDTLALKDVAMTNITLSGELRQPGTPDFSIADLTFDVRAQHLPLLLERAQLTTALPLIQKADAATLSGKLSAKGSAVQLDVLGSLSDANIRLSGSLSSEGILTTYNALGIDIAHPGFQTFMKLVNPQFNAFKKLDGQFKLKGTLSGTPKDFQLKDGALTIGTQRLNGDIAVQNQAVRTITAALTTPDIDIERFLFEVPDFYTSGAGFSKNPLNMSAFEKLRLTLALTANRLIYKELDLKRVELEITAADKVLALNNLSAGTGQEASQFTLSGKLDWNTTPSLQADISVVSLPLRTDFMLLDKLTFGGGGVSLSGSVKGRGSSAFELAGALSGGGKIDFAGSTLIGADIEQVIPLATRALQRAEEPAVFEPEIQRVLRSGKTTVQRLAGDFSVANGIFRAMDMTLETQNTTASPTQIILDIPKQTLEISVPVSLKPMKNLPPFILGLSLSNGRIAYTQTLTDFFAQMRRLVQTEAVADIKEQEAALLRSQAEAKASRELQARQSVADAEAAVKRMAQAVHDFPHDQARLTLQEAQDALNLVHQLAIKEMLTEAQHIQLLEHSRLALLKAAETEEILRRETSFDTRKTLEGYIRQAQLIERQVQMLAADKPHIPALPRLLETIQAHLDRLQQAYQSLGQSLMSLQTQQVLAIAQDSLKQIEQAAAHAARFNVSEGTSAGSGVKGSISRAGL